MVSLTIWYVCGISQVLVDRVVQQSFREQQKMYVATHTYLSIIEQESGGFIFQARIQQTSFNVLSPIGNAVAFLDFDLEELIT